MSQNQIYWQFLIYDDVPNAVYTLLSYEYHHIYCPSHIYGDVRNSTETPLSYAHRQFYRLAEIYDDARNAMDTHSVTSIIILLNFHVPNSSTWREEAFLTASDTSGWVRLGPNYIFWRFVEGSRAQGAPTPVGLFLRNSFFSSLRGRTALKFGGWVLFRPT